MKERELIMNREILFRGKSKENGNWYYGYYCKEDNNACFQEEFRVKHFIRFQQNLDWGLTKQWLEEVESTTIGQYTGLKDENDKKIFEGDIVSYVIGKPDGNSIEVDKEIVTFDYSQLLRLTYADYLEVIGNIHENDIESEE